MPTKDVKVTSVDGLGYGRVRFTGFAPHGKHERQVSLICTADEIVRLADAIRGCHVNYEDPRTGRRPKSLEEARDARYEPMCISHAVWHLRNPERLMPCLVEDGYIIDVPEEASEIVKGGSIVLKELVPRKVEDPSLNGQWTLRGYDTFEGEYYPLEGTYPSAEAADAAAQARLKHLEETQPTVSSGGQNGGIQDQVYVVSPDGRQTRVMPR